jgi:AraC-like DNA-binding protein/mannose-6-phosphate isomerase-like protein (cupin superfamily)
MASSSRHRKTKSHTTVLVDASQERKILDFRPLGFRDAIVLGRYRYAEAHPALPLHSHGRMVEICYLESGEQTYWLGSQRYDLRGGDVFVTLPHERHGSAQAPEGKGVLYWLLLRMPEGHRGLLSLRPAESRQVVQRLLAIPARSFPGGEGIGRLLRRVMAAFDRVDDPLRRVNVRNLLLRLLLDVLEASHGTVRRVSPGIQAVEQLIAANVDQTLPVSRLARVAHLSESRFKARFKAEVGIPPADYALRQRIDRARHLLWQGDLSVTAVAMQLGFSSTQYFATVFKRYTGHTPSTYWRQSDGAE